MAEKTKRERHSTAQIPKLREQIHNLSANLTALQKKYDELQQTTFIIMRQRNRLAAMVRASLDADTADVERPSTPGGEDSPASPDAAKPLHLE